MTVQSFNNLPSLSRTLNRAAQRWVNEQVTSLKDDLVANVPDRALAAPAIRDGFYVRTPDSSGYSQSVRAVRALFAHPETLFPADVQTLFAGAGSLFARDTHQLFDPRIVGEVDRPGALSATIGNCTGWAAQAEYGEVSAPFVLQTVTDFFPDTTAFNDLWRNL
jgi:hypothetical protein